MDLEKMMMTVKNVNDAIVAISSESNVNTEQLFAVDDTASPDASKTIKDYLDAPDGANVEKDLRKLLGAAVVVAKEKGLLPEMPGEVTEMASAIDDTLVKIKSDYQVGSGMISPEEAVDKVIDHAAARVVDTINTAFDSGIVNQVVTEGIINLAYMIPKIGPVVGPMVEGQRELISSAVARVEKPVRNVIIKGVRVVSSKAKEFAHSAVTKIKNFARETGRKIGKRILSLA